LIIGKLRREKILREVKVWSRLKSEFLVQYKSSWTANGDWIFEENDKYQTIPNQLILYIQMELCRMTLREALDQVNKELNQNYDNGITIIGAYIASE
jgi:hypothetical protein